MKKAILTAVVICGTIAASVHQAKGQYLPRLRSHDIISRYSIPIRATPADSVKLVFDFNQLEVKVPKDIGVSGDVTDASKLISFSTPERKDAVANEIVSIAWKGEVCSEGKFGAPLEKMLFRNNGRGRFSLAVMSKKHASVYVTRKLVSIVPTLFDDLFDKETGIVELDKLTPAMIRSHPWPFNSSTDVVLEEDNRGFLLMKGTIEFLVMPAVDGVAATMQIEGKLFVEAGSKPMLNLGNGTKLAVKGISQPVEIVDDDGTVHKVTKGPYCRTHGKWTQVAQEKTSNPRRDNASVARKGQPDTAEGVSEQSLDSSVQWIKQIQQPFPEDAFGFTENGLTQASDKPIRFEIAEVGSDKKTNKTVLLVLSLKLKAKGKNQFGEFEFPLTKREKQKNLVSVRTPSGEITLYRQGGAQLSDWQRRMIGALLRISRTRVTAEDADFLNALQ